MEGTEGCATVIVQETVVAEAVVEAESQEAPIAGDAVGARKRVPIPLVWPGKKAEAVKSATVNGTTGASEGIPAVGDAETKRNLKPNTEFLSRHINGVARGNERQTAAVASAAGVQVIGQGVSSSAAPLLVRAGPRGDEAVRKAVLGMAEANKQAVCISLLREVAHHYGFSLRIVPLAGLSSGNEAEQGNTEGGDIPEASPPPLRPLSVKLGRPGDNADITYEEEAPEEGWDAEDGYPEEDEEGDPLDYLPVRRAPRAPARLLDLGALSRLAHSAFGDVGLAPRARRPATKRLRPAPLAKSRLRSETEDMDEDPGEDDENLDAEDDVGDEHQPRVGVRGRDASEEGAGNLEDDEDEEEEEAEEAARPAKRVRRNGSVFTGAASRLMMQAGALGRAKGRPALTREAGGPVLEPAEPDQETPVSEDEAPVQATRVRGRGTTGSHSLGNTSANPRELPASEDETPVQAIRVRGRGTLGSHSLGNPSANPKASSREPPLTEDDTPVQATLVRGRGTTGSHSLGKTPSANPKPQLTASSRNAAKPPFARNKLEQATSPPSEDGLDPEEDAGADEDELPDEAPRVRGRGVSGLRSAPAPADEDDLPEEAPRVRGRGVSGLRSAPADEDDAADEAPRVRGRGVSGLRGFAGGESACRSSGEAEEKLGRSSADEGTPRVRGRGAVGSFASGGPSARLSNGRASNAGGNGRSLFGAALSGMGR